VSSTEARGRVGLFVWQFRWHSNLLVHTDASTQTTRIPQMERSFCEPKSIGAEEQW
jgi:hypothetical protein